MVFTQWIVCEREREKEKTKKDKKKERKNKIMKEWKNERKKTTKMEVVKWHWRW